MKCYPDLRIPRKKHPRRGRRRRQHLREDKGAERVDVHVTAAQRGPGRQGRALRRIAQILRLIELLVHFLLCHPPLRHGKEAWHLIEQIYSKFKI